MKKKGAGRTHHSRSKKNHMDKLEKSPPVKTREAMRTLIDFMRCVLVNPATWGYSRLYMRGFFDKPDRIGLFINGRVRVQPLGTSVIMGTTVAYGLALEDFCRQVIIEGEIRDESLHKYPEKGRLEYVANATMTVAW